MKSPFLACLGLAVTSRMALAGGPVVVEPDPVPVVAHAPAVHDWSGLYVGLGLGSSSGDYTVNTISTVWPLTSDMAASIYAGYLVQRGNFVFGGELAYLKSGLEQEAVPEGLNETLDLKARVGWAANRTLFYGVAGYSKSSYFGLADDNQDLSGMVYGVGIDFAASDRVTIGVEYLVHDLDGDTLFPGQTRNIKSKTISARISFAF